MSLAIVWSTVMAILTVTALVGNSLIICVTCKSQRLGTPSNVFSSILSMVDIYCAVVNLLKYTFLSFYPSMPHVGCATLSSLSVIGCGTNLWMIYIVSIDKLVAIYRPFKYRTCMFKARAVQLGILAVVIALVFEAILIAMSIDWRKSGECSVTRIVTPSLTVSLTVFTGVITVQLVVMHAAMFNKALKHQKDIADGKLGKNRRDRSKIMRVLDIKAMKTCSVVLGTFLLMWIPRLVLFNLIAFSNDVDHYVQIGSLGSIFPVMNSALDPVIYAIMRSDVRSEIVRLFKSRWGDRESISSRTHRSCDLPTTSS